MGESSGSPHLAPDRDEFARLIWHTASPRWEFAEPTFQRTAASFANPDHIEIVIHNYRWRLGLADGEATHAELEEQLAAGMKPTPRTSGDGKGKANARGSEEADRAAREELLAFIGRTTGVDRRCGCCRARADSTRTRP
ncbi:hypothetical protein ACRAWC_13410 [Leifsonia sp. L25]|uniref:hypothetical protein n=1 Tax=Actinomycetes TaxID=1760 RepID=UPI003D681300